LHQQDFTDTVGIPSGSEKEHQVPPPAYRYASYDLDQSVHVAKLIDDHGGLASSDELAVLLKYTSKNNGTYLTRVANARLFGLVEGPSSAMRPTTLAIDIIRPDYAETKARSLLQAFENVPLYSAFLDYFHGQALPNEQGMKNALENRFKIDASRSGFVLTRLLNSAEQAGLFAMAGDRTKMIRPSIMSTGGNFRRSTAPTESAGGVDSTVTASTATSPSPPTRVGADARANKVIDGVLDLLPPLNQKWDEEEFMQWLSFFENALRVVYKIESTNYEEEDTE